MSNPFKQVFIKVKDEVEYQYLDKKTQLLYLRKIDKEEAIEYYKSLDEKMLKYAYKNTQSKRDLKIIEKVFKERGYQYSKEFQQFMK